MIAKVDRVEEVQKPNPQTYMVEMIDADSDEHSFALSMHQIQWRELGLD